MQQKYIQDLIKEMGMLECKPTRTPIEINHRLGKKIEEAPIDGGTYQ